MNVTVPADEVIHDINRWDVLMGRGKLVHHHEGNLVYRSIVKARHDEYKDRPEDRHKIALEVISSIERQGGRFLRPIWIPDQQDSVWVKCARSVVRTKVKQALRDMAKQEDYVATPAKKKAIAKSKVVASPDENEKSRAAIESLTRKSDPVLGSVCSPNTVSPNGIDMISRDQRELRQPHFPQPLSAAETTNWRHGGFSAPVVNQIAFGRSCVGETFVSQPTGLMTLPIDPTAFSYSLPVSNASVASDDPLKGYLMNEPNHIHHPSRPSMEDTVVSQPTRLVIPCFEPMASSQTYQGTNAAVAGTGSEVLKRYLMQERNHIPSGLNGTEIAELMAGLRQQQFDKFL